MQDQIFSQILLNRKCKCKLATKGKSEIYSSNKSWYIQFLNQKLQTLTRVSKFLPSKGHSFMTSAKWKIFNAPPFTFTAIQFWSAHPSAVLRWMSIIEFWSIPLPDQWCFEIFVISFAKAHNVYTSFKSIKKMTGNETHINWAYFHDKPLYFFCF